MVTLPESVVQENGPSVKTKTRPFKSKEKAKSDDLTGVKFNVESPDLRKRQREELTQMSLRIQKLEKAIAELTKDNPSSCLDVLQSTITGNGDIQPKSLTSFENESEEDILNAFLLDDQDMLDDSFEYSINHLQNDCSMALYGPTGASEVCTDTVRFSLTNVDRMRIYKETIQRHILSMTNDGFKSPNSSSSDFSHYPPHIFFRSLLFPCPPPDQGPLDMESLTDYLPSYERACALLNNYLYHFGWSCMIAAIDDLYNSIDYFYPSKTNIKLLDPTDAKKLSALCTIFLIGTVLDLDLDAEAIASQAELFHLLVRALLASQCITDDTTVETLQAFILLVWFYQMCPGGSSSGKERWILSGFISKLIQGIGLHRDSRQYLTDVEQCNRFEQLFWEYNIMDIWQSFVLGRPTTVLPIFTFCQPPRSVKSVASFKPEFYTWKFDFTRSIAEIPGLGVDRPAAYADVLNFEKQILMYHVPPSLDWHNNLIVGELPGIAAQKYMVAVLKQLALLYLHRPFFWHATSKTCSQRNALLLSHSVAVVYNSASTIVTLTKEIWQMHPKLIERMTPIWRYCETATQTLGVLIFRNPEGLFAKNAFKKMEDACNMFREAKQSFYPQADIQNLINMCATVRETFAKAPSSISESSTES